MMESIPVTRRHSLKLMGLGTAGIFLYRKGAVNEPSQHIITLSFDDGFEKSSIRTAEIFEKYGLSATINVIARAHEKNFSAPNEYHKWKTGDFTLWNELQSRGHEIMPHGLIHEDYTKLSFEDATSSMECCLDIFSTELKDFKREKAIFNFPYNASNPGLEEWLSSKVRAFRTGGNGLNPLPFNGQKKLTCISQGPGNIDEFLKSVMADFLLGPPGWFIFNTHGLDNEGWGPLSSGLLDELVHQWKETANVSVLNVSQALDLVKQYETLK